MLSHNNFIHGKKDDMTTWLTTSIKHTSNRDVIKWFWIVCVQYHTKCQTLLNVEVGYAHKALHKKRWQLIKLKVKPSYNSLDTVILYTLPEFEYKA